MEGLNQETFQSRPATTLQSAKDSTEPDHMDMQHKEKSLEEDKSSSKLDPTIPQSVPIESPSNIVSVKDEHTMLQSEQICSQPILISVHSDKNTTKIIQKESLFNNVPSKSGKISTQLEAISHAIDTKPQPVEIKPKLLETEPNPLETKPKPVETAPKSPQTGPRSSVTEANPVETEPNFIETEPNLIETEPKPVETEPKPVETEPKPVETEPKPVETELKPVETELKPVETEPKPVETESKPVEIESKPVETESKPVESALIPVESAPVPVETKPIPVVIIPQSVETVPQSIEIVDEPILEVKYSSTAVGDFDGNTSCVVKTEPLDCIPHEEEGLFPLPHNFIKQEPVDDGIKEEVVECSISSVTLVKSEGVTKELLSTGGSVEPQGTQIQIKCDVDLPSLAMLSSSSAATNASKLNQFLGAKVEELDPNVAQSKICKEITLSAAILRMIPAENKDTTNSDVSLSSDSSLIPLNGEQIKDDEELYNVQKEVFSLKDEADCEVLPITQPLQNYLKNEVKCLAYLKQNLSPIKNILKAMKTEEFECFSSAGEVVSDVASHYSSDHPLVNILMNLQKLPGISKSFDIIENGSTCSIEFINGDFCDSLKLREQIFEKHISEVLKPFEVSEPIESSTKEHFDTRTCSVIKYVSSGLSTTLIDPSSTGSNGVDEAPSLFRRAKQVASSSQSPTRGRGMRRKRSQGTDSDGASSQPSTKISKSNKLVEKTNYSLRRSSRKKFNGETGANIPGDPMNGGCNSSNFVLDNTLPDVEVSIIASKRSSSNRYENDNTNDKDKTDDTLHESPKRASRNYKRKRTQGSGPLPTEPRTNTSSSLYGHKPSESKEIQSTSDNSEKLPNLSDSSNKKLSKRKRDFVKSTPDGDIAAQNTSTDSSEKSSSPARKRQKAQRVTAKETIDMDESDSGSISITEEDGNNSSIEMINDAQQDFASNDSTENDFIRKEKADIAYERKLLMEKMKEYEEQQKLIAQMKEELRKKMEVIKPNPAATEVNKQASTSNNSQENNSLKSSNASSGSKSSLRFFRNHIEGSGNDGVDKSSTTTSIEAIVRNSASVQQTRRGLQQVLAERYLPSQRQKKPVANFTTNANNNSDNLRNIRGLTSANKIPDTMLGATIINALRLTTNITTTQTNQASNKDKADNDNHIPLSDEDEEEDDVLDKAKEEEVEKSRVVLGKVPALDDESYLTMKPTILSEQLRHPMVTSTKGNQKVPCFEVACHDVTIFACPECYYQTNCRFRYRTHHYVHSYTQYKCDMCDYSSTSREKTLQHEIRHKTDKELVCDVCNYTSFETKALLRHKKTHEVPSESDPSCKQCSYVGGSFVDIRRHILSEHGIQGLRLKIECLLCPNQRFASFLALGRHVKTHMNSKGEYMCSHCEYTDGDQMAMQDHVRLHSKVPYFQCDLCSFQANTRKLLLEHLHVHRPCEPLKCKLCEYTANTKNDLEKHTSAHSNEIYACNMCSYFCNGLSELLNHKKREHVSLGQQEPEVCCPVCKKYTTRRNCDMKRHLLMLHDYHGEKLMEALNKLYSSEFHRPQPAAAATTTVSQGQSEE